MLLRAGKYLTQDYLHRVLQDRHPDELTLDLTDAQFVNPAGLVVLAVLLDMAAAEEWFTEVELPRSDDVQKYLSRMGLQELLDAAEAKCLLPQVRHHPPNLRFVPLQRFDSSHPAEDICDLVLARLDAWGDGILQGTLYNALIELGLNIEEHAQESGFVAAQCYKQQTVSLAVGDFGVGIHGSLAAAGHPFPTPADAIIKAVTTRLSAKEKDGGAGLPEIQRIFDRHKGRMTIVSGGESVRFRPGSAPRPSVSGYPSPGTFLFGELPWR